MSAGVATLIGVLSAASVLGFAFVIFRNLRHLRDLKGEAFGLLRVGLFVVAWAGLCLVPALGAAGLVFARYAELGWLTRLTGLAPAVFLLFTILYVVGFVMRDVWRT